MVAEKRWASSSPRTESSIETGVTTFTPHGSTPEEWCIGVIDALDQHHNSYSHDPGYTLLEVYGVAPSKEIQTVFAEFGFAEFTVTPDGFVARKNEP